MKQIDLIEAPHLKKDIPNFKAADTVRIYVKIKEDDKVRIQVFEGIRTSDHAGNSELLPLPLQSDRVSTEQTGIRRKDREIWGGRQRRALLGQRRT